MLMINAELHTMDRNGRVIPEGYLAWENGRITALGSMEELTEVPAGAFDAGHLPVYPGLIDAHTHLGLFGDSLTFEGDDGNEDTDPVTPQLRALDAVNAMDGYFSEALRAGVTTVITCPGSANPIAGQAAALKTCGKRVDKMIVKAPAAIKFALGENPKSTYNDKEQMPVTRMATAALIRETLAKAKKYYEDKCRYEQDPENMDEPEYDVKNEALLPLFRREVPAHFHAHRADDIFTAVRIAREFELEYVLVHATDAHLVWEELGEEGFRGILSGPILTDRSKPELKHQSPQAAGILSRNGIPTAIITDHPETPIQYLLLCAMVAVREGMSREEAMKALTCYPAAICGLDDRVGSLEPGKDADCVVFSGDPLELMTRPQAVMVNGKMVLNHYCDNV